MNSNTGLPSVSLPIVVMAGGTGGHVFPAIAVAKELQEKGHTIRWLGTKQGIEHRLVPQYGFAIDYLSISGLRGKGVGKLLTAPFLLFRAVLQAIGYLRKFKPLVVLGMGGFASGPGAIAAKLLGIPLVIHEQNAIPGMTNKLLSKVAKRNLQAFPNALHGFNASATLGNPVRREFFDGQQNVAQRYQQRQGALHILVVGGSLGAQIFNECLPAALALIDNDKRPVVTHQTGKNKLDFTRANYQQAGVEVNLVEFIDDIAKEYQAADLVICRAGALTVSEIAATAVASVLVPYPFAVDDHQTANARYLSDAGAARLIPQKQLTPKMLSELIIELSDRSLLEKMASKAKVLSYPSATEDVATVCVEVAHV